MKILGINASHRKNSSSEAFVDYMFTKLNKLHTVTKINLLDKNLKHCDACGKCEKTNKCEVIDDDMSGIYRQLEEADLIILSTPTYFGMPSGLLKVVMDRTNAFFHKRLLKGKYGAVISSGAGNPGGIELCVKNCQHFFYDHGIITIPFSPCFTDSIKQSNQRFNEPFGKHTSVALDKLCDEIMNIKI